MHIIQKTLPTYEYDYTDNFDTHFRPCPEVVAYDPYFVDPQYGFDPYWDEEIYDQDKLEYNDTYNKPNDQIESDNLITDAHVSDALRHTVIDLWTVNPQLPDTSPIPNFRLRPQNQQRQIAVIDDQILSQLQVAPDGITRFLPLSTNLPLKNKRKMLAKKRNAERVSHALLALIFQLHTSLKIHVLLAIRINWCKKSSLKKRLQINCFAYLDCSAKMKNGVDKVFDETDKCRFVNTWLQVHNILM